MARQFMRVGLMLLEGGQSGGSELLERAILAIAGIAVEQGDSLVMGLHLSLDVSRIEFLTAQVRQIVNYFLVLLIQFGGGRDAFFSGRPGHILAGLV